jgi:hypothetical protein
MMSIVEGADRPASDCTVGLLAKYATYTVAMWADIEGALIARLLKDEAMMGALLGATIIARRDRTPKMSRIVQKVITVCNIDGLMFRAGSADDKVLYLAVRK